MHFSKLDDVPNSSLSIHNSKSDVNVWGLGDSRIGLKSDGKWLFRIDIGTAANHNRESKNVAKKFYK